MKKTSEFIHIHKVCSWLQVIRKRYNLSISQPYVHFKSSNFLFSYTPAERKHDHFRNRWEMPSSGQLTPTRRPVSGWWATEQRHQFMFQFKQTRFASRLSISTHPSMHTDHPAKNNFYLWTHTLSFLSLLGGAAVMLTSITDPKLSPSLHLVSAGDCFHCCTPWRTLSKAWRVINKHVS